MSPASCSTSKRLASIPGDSACSLPPYSLSPEIILGLREQSKALALALNVVGLMNVQFAVKDNEIYLIEVNPRASRTVPFVAKAVLSPIASIAARVMAGEKLDAFDLVNPEIDSYAVKEAVMPFARFPGVDTILGPEMRSTGEVMGADKSFAMAFLKAQLGAGTVLPNEGNVFLSIKDGDKLPQLVETAKLLKDQGFNILATRGTAAFLAENGVEAEQVAKAYELGRHIVDRMKDGEVHLVMNTTEGTQSVNDSREMRNVALMDKIPYFTTLAASNAAARAMKARSEREIEVHPLQDA